MKPTLLFLFISLTSFGQFTGIVRDSVSGEPIPYVNVWIENSKNGVSANAKGTFSIEKSSKNEQLIFSAIGYKTKKIGIDSAATVLLNPYSYELKAVSIEIPKRDKSIKLSAFGGSWVLYYTPETMAKFFPVDDEVLKHPFLKEISLRTNNESGDCTIKIQVVKPAADGSPGESLIEENIIATVTKGDHNTTINVEKYGVKVPPEGIFIVTQRLVIKENRFVSKTKIPSLTGGKREYETVKYEPMFGQLPSDVNDTWFWSGKWRQEAKEIIRNPQAYENLLMKKYHDKYKTVAMSITLTN